MLDLEYFHGELQHREQIEIGVMHQIGHIAVHEQFARHQTDDFIGGDAGIGTADPQEFRVLLAHQGTEETGVFFLHLMAPLFVVGEKLRQGFHGRAFSISDPHDAGTAP